MFDGTLNRPLQKQLSRGVLMKSSSENMQQTYRRRSMPMCDFTKVETTNSFTTLNSFITQVIIYINQSIRTNQYTGFYIIGIFVVKEFNSLSYLQVQRLLTYAGDFRDFTGFGYFYFGQSTRNSFEKLCNERD